MEILKIQIMKNKVTYKNRENVNLLKRGSIYEDPNDGELYILAEVDVEVYVAISLEDGNRWSDQSSCIQTAVDGLVLISRSVEIEITPINNN